LLLCIVCLLCLFALFVCFVCLFALFVCIVCLLLCLLISRRLHEAAKGASESVQLRVLQTLVALLMRPQMPEKELRAALLLCSVLAASAGAGGLAVR
jgi:hypothetical protein